MNRITLLTAGIVLGFSSCELFAQIEAKVIQEAEVPAIARGVQVGELDFAGMVREMGGGITKEIKEKLVLRMKQRGREKIALQIEFIDRVCKLDSKQKKQFGFVAKGVIQKSVSEIMAKIPVKERDGDKAVAKVAVPAAKIQVANEGGQQDNQFQVEGGPDVFQPAVGQFFFAGGQADELLFLLDDLSNNGQVLNLQKHPLWKKQLGRILKPAQIDALKKEQAARLIKRRKAAIAYTVSVFSSELLLSDKQQKQLSEVIDQRFGKVIDNNLGNAIQYGNNLSAIILSSGDKELLKILTPVQKSIVKRKMRMLGGFALPNVGIQQDNIQQDFIPAGLDAENLGQDVKNLDAKKNR